MVGGVVGHEGHYRLLNTVLHALLLCVTPCYTVGQELREDYPVITLSISSLTAATRWEMGCGPGRARPLSAKTLDSANPVL